MGLRSVQRRVNGETRDLSAIKIDGFLINSLRDFPALTRLHAGPVRFH